METGIQNILQYIENSEQANTFVTDNFLECSKHKECIKNFNEFVIYSTQLNYTFDIVLTETWDIEGPNIMGLDDYLNIYKNGQFNQNDGIIMYIVKNLEINCNGRIQIPNNKS